MPILVPHRLIYFKFTSAPWNRKARRENSKQTLLSPGSSQSNPRNNLWVSHFPDCLPTSETFLRDLACERDGQQERQNLVKTLQGKQDLDDKW